VRRFPRGETQVVMYLESFQAFGATRSREPQRRRASFPFLRRARGRDYAHLGIATAILYVALAGELAAMGLL
jgi:hypothetical protein